MAATQTIQLTALALWASLVLNGCDVVSQPSVVSAVGTYSGVTPTGQALVLTLKQDGQALRAHGTIDGRPVALAGVLTWTAVGTIMDENGAVSLSILRLTPDGSMLALETANGEMTELVPGGAPAAAAPGPFSGRYAAVGAQSAFATVTLAQNDSLISGVGTVLGQPAAIAARATSGTEAEGVITFADESLVRFEAELAADSRSLTVRGLGTPVTLNRL